MLAARKRIACKSEWLGGVIAAAPLVENRLGISIMGTDGWTVYYDPDWFGYFDAYVEGCLLHEYLHCLCDHIGRREDRDVGLWNVAADYAINPLVTKMFSMPKQTTLLDPRFAGMSVEAIYDRLGGEGNSFAAKTGQNLGVQLANPDLPADLSGKPLQQARRRWRSLIKAAGKPPEFLRAAIDEI
jgi:predicted metal-dependent peptidase